MKRFALAVTLLLAASLAFAERSDPVKDILSTLIASADEACPRLNANFETQPKAPQSKISAYAIRSAQTSLCTCMPRQMRKLQSSLSADELRAEMTPSGFLEKYYQPKVLYACVREQMQSGYSEGCAERYAEVLQNAPNYCSCMSQAMEKLPTAEIARMGIAYNEYLGRANEAKKRAEAPPEPPAAAKQFLSIEGTCEAK